MNETDVPYEGTERNQSVILGVLVNKRHTKKILAALVLIRVECVDNYWNMQMPVEICRQRWNVGGQLLVVLSPGPAAFGAPEEPGLTLICRP